MNLPDVFVATVTVLLDLRHPPRHGKGRDRDGSPAQPVKHHAILFRLPWIDLRYAVQYDRNCSKIRFDTVPYIWYTQAQKGEFPTEDD